MQPLAIEPLEPRRLLSSVRVAVIGDYGAASDAEAAVAKLVRSWHPAAVLTTGDNNYPAGGADAIDANVGRDYHRYLAGYAGTFGEGSRDRRFFPSPGNHDWQPGSLQPYTDFFDLPVTSPTGGERYYDFANGPVHFFAIDSDEHEPDGVTADSAQAAWLRQAMAAATEPFKVVYFHHPPYSSGPHGGSTDLRWPFKDWGASLVLSGHDHTYERLAVDGLPYVVNGLGGQSEYEFAEGGTDPNSLVRFNADFGAVRIDASSKRMTVRFVTAGRKTIDRFTVDAPVVPPTLTASFASVPDSLTPGRKAAVLVRIENGGPSWAGRLLAEVTLGPSGSDVASAIASKSVRLKLRAGGHQTLRLVFRPPDVSPGRYDLSAVLRLLTDTSAVVAATTSPATVRG
ncbi:MAG TPA: metallophosphoesterase [Humisphaera sp.]